MATEEQTDTGIVIVNLRSGGATRAGQRLTITNRTVSKLSFPLKKNGSPTGNVTFTIRDLDDNVDATKVLGDASALSATLNREEVTFDTPVFINEEVRILVEFSGGSAGNDVSCYATTSSVKAGEYFTHYSSPSYTDHGGNGTDYDGAYIYTYVEGQATSAPTVSTQACTGTTHNTSIGHGNINSTGGTHITQHGHCWGTSANPTTSDSKTTNGMVINTGQFTSAITSLLPGTTYHVRAYAINSKGTAYGADVEITTGSTISRRHVWVEGEYTHYFGQSGAEYRIKGEGVTTDQNIWDYF